MSVPINIFFHVACLNHWADVIGEQIATLKESGIYDECESVYVGCLGKEEDFEKLKEIFSQNGITKAHFFHDTDIKQYEFFTLKILKTVCNNSPKLFYGAYIMSKGVSYPPPMPEKQGGDFWRRYMMDFVIKRWRENYKALDIKFIGYDLAGVKVIPKRVSPSESTHISGNMWMFNSEYIRSLCSIETLDTTNRFLAETWVTTGEPIIYMPCNLFVDYFNRQDYDDFMKNFKELPDYCL